MEDDIRQVIDKDDLGMIVSNIGVNADLSAIYTTNSAMHTAFVQVQLKKEHKISSFDLHRSCPAKAQPATCRSFPPSSRPAAWSIPS